MIIERAAPLGTASPTRVHFENVTSLGPVFEVTSDRLRNHLAVHAITTHVEISIGADGKDFGRAVERADVLFGWKFDRDAVARYGQRLKWIHLSGAGVDHLLPLDWLPRRTVLTNSRGIHGQKSQEYALMALLMLNSRLPRLISAQQAARWDPIFTSSIAGKTVLIVGIGKMGAGAARWAKRLDLHVIGVRRSGRKAAHVDEMHCPRALHGLLPRADFLLLAAPLTSETRHLIGARELALLPDLAGVINIGRAGLIDYAALRADLERGRLSAVLDVFEPEPLPADDPMWTAPNTILTPHCSSDDRDHYIDLSLDLFFRNLVRLRSGKPLLNRVSTAHGY